MNDVSWRRILEQVDSGQRSDQDFDPLPISARTNIPRPSLHRNADPWFLEDELSRLTRRGAQTDTRSHTQPLRKRQPSPGQHALQLQKRMEQAAIAATEEAAPPLPVQDEPGKPSAVRNLIAITLSFAVVGFAAYQFHEVALQNGAGDDVSIHQHTNDTASAGSNNAENDQSAIRVIGNRLDLRPSLASRSDLPSKKLAAAKALDTASSVNMANIAADQPSAENDTPDNAVNETHILTRGHDILEKGHVSGARLIFEYLADRGSALGAFALAQTYDPVFLSTHDLPADAANETLAKQWYQMAETMTDATVAEVK